MWNTSPTFAIFRSAPTSLPRGPATIPPFEPTKPNRLSTSRKRDSLFRTCMPTSGRYERSTTADASSENPLRCPLTHLLGSGLSHERYRSFASATDISTTSYVHPGPNDRAFIVSVPFVENVHR